MSESTGQGLGGTGGRALGVSVAGKGFPEGVRMSSLYTHTQLGR